MNISELVFVQIMEYLPLTTFRRCVAKRARRYRPGSAGQRQGT